MSATIPLRRSTILARRVRSAVVVGAGPWMRVGSLSMDFDIGDLGEKLGSLPPDGSATPPPEPPKSKTAPATTGTGLSTNAKVAIGVGAVLAVVFAIVRFG